MLQGLKGVIRRRLGLERINGAIENLTVRAEQSDVRLGFLEGFQQVVFGTVAAEYALLPESPVVSVVMATRNRRRLLERAVASVQQSVYGHWQLVVIDDGSTDDTSTYLASLSDPRIVTMRTDGVGAAAARNVGLDAATGEWVAFLDDDNVIGSMWLRAIVDHGCRHPDVPVVYGAQVRQYEKGLAAPEHMHLLYVDPFDRKRLSGGNFIDLGALAVRNGVDQLWFDPALRRFIDWEMVVRLAAVHEVRPLPVLSGVYFTSHDTRITLVGELDDWAQFGRRLQDPSDPIGRPRPRP